MSRIIIIVVAGFIVLAGGAIAIMQQMEIGPFSKKAPATPVEQVQKGPEPPRFVAMDPIVVPIFDNDHVVATIQMEIQIETTPSREPKLVALMPKLTDAFITDLRSYVPRVLRDKKDLDTEVIKKRLQIIGERAIGTGIFDAVLIQAVSQRKV